MLCLAKPSLFCIIAEDLIVKNVCDQEMTFYSYFTAENALSLSSGTELALKLFWVGPTSHNPQSTSHGSGSVECGLQTCGNQIVWF